MELPPAASFQSSFRFFWSMCAVSVLSSSFEVKVLSLDPYALACHAIASLAISRPEKPSVRAAA